MGEKIRPASIYLQLERSRTHGSADIISLLSGENADTKPHTPKLDDDYATGDGTPCFLIAV